jgi:lysozyme
MNKVIAWFFVLLGSILGVVWYFDVNQAGESWSDVLSDPLGSIQDLFSRGAAIVQGRISTDPKTIAAGLIAKEEGFSSKVYPDPPGQNEKHSIGYGHQLVDGDGFDLSSTISQPDAFALLISDLDSYAAFVDGRVTSDLTANERAALYSFCYNIGEGAFASSTLLRDVNSGDLGSASGEFDRWIYSNGQISTALQNRRNDEQALFSQDIPQEDSTS